MLFKNKSLYYDHWFSNGLVLVQQSRSFAQVLRISLEIPNTRNSQRIVCSSGLCMLLKNCRYSSAVTAPSPNPCDTPGGQMCFSESRNKNYKIRSLFLENLISAPHVTFFLNNLFDNLNWKKYGHYSKNDFSEIR